MTQQIAARVEPVRLDLLRPTQATVGFAEVAAKRRHWKRMDKADREVYLARHFAPIVLGLGHEAYLIDCHHECRALLESGQETVLAETRAQLNHLKRSEFWPVLDMSGWCHPYDAAGERLPYCAIPETLQALADDPWRSLAAELRRAGGYAKTAAPFSEFRWADFLRRRLTRPELAQAAKLARSLEAAHLPGWCGPHQ